MSVVINTPIDLEDVSDLRSLHAGDSVLLTGKIYTARDQAHRRMFELLEKGEPLPFDIRGSAVYYAGPTPDREGIAIGSVGPTTSGRMDSYSPRLLDIGNRIMIGKGRRSSSVREAIVRNSAVYLAAPGGAGALMAACVVSSEIVAWPDLGCEAVRRLRVENMPLTVVIDTEGNDLYETGPSAYLAATEEKYA